MSRQSRESRGDPIGNGTDLEPDAMGAIVLWALVALAFSLFWVTLGLWLSGAI